MYCENCGALRQAGNAFCVSCGTSLGAAGSAQGGAQSSFGYGDASAVATPDNALGVRLAIIASCCGVASGWVWLFGTFVWSRFAYSESEYLTFRLPPGLDGYGPTSEWLFAPAIPVLTAGILLAAMRKDQRVGIAAVLGALILFFGGITQFISSIFAKYDFDKAPVALLSIFMLSMVLSIASVCCVAVMGFRLKIHFEMPSAKVLVAAAGGAATAALSLLTGQNYYGSAWSTSEVLNGITSRINDSYDPTWVFVVSALLAAAIFSVILLATYLGPSAAASTATVGAIFLGLRAIAFARPDVSKYGLSLRYGWMLGVFASCCLVVTAVLAFMESTKGSGEIRMRGSSITSQPLSE